MPSISGHRVPKSNKRKKTKIALNSCHGLLYPYIIFLIFYIKPELAKGSRVRIPRGPAAVIGDESRESPTVPEMEWEGSASRMIRKPEDLPVQYPQA